MSDLDPTALEAHRAALVGHCYRMLGSAAEADDAVQETMVRAWKALPDFEERAALRTWLHRIATRVCLDALRDRKRRIRATELGPPGNVDSPLTTLPASDWVEPIPDVQAIPAADDPAERVALRQSIRLAFVAALQHLPPRQRAALLLADVLGWPAGEVAATLETSVASVNSALQRARATLADRDVASPRAPLPEPDAALLERYVAAFERYDVAALAALCRDDVTMSMPPIALWLRGPEELQRWLLGPGAACRGSRLVPVEACGSPAYAQYKPDGAGRWLPWALLLLEVDAAQRVAAMTFFLDVATLYPRFGLPGAL